LHALCSRVLQSTREELRVAYRQWAVEYARQVMRMSDACLRCAIRPRRRPRCPHLYTCMCVAQSLRGGRQRCYSQHSTAGRHVVSFTPGVDGSQRIRSTASATFAGRLANTQDCGHRGSVCTPSPSPQLLPFTRRALTLALHSTAEHATNRTQRSVDQRVSRGAQRWQAPLASEGRRYTALRCRAFHPPARPAGSARR
jgi:hypothetical protein